MLNSTAWCQSSTDSTYCLPLSTARLLVADALRLRVADSLNNLQASTIAILEFEKLISYRSFTNLLKLSEDKYQKQKEITSDMVRFSDSWKEESEYYQTRSKKFRRQRNGLAAGLVGVIILTLIK